MVCKILIPITSRHIFIYCGFVKIIYTKLINRTSIRIYQNSNCIPYKSCLHKSRTRAIYRLKCTNKKLLYNTLRNLWACFKGITISSKQRFTSFVNVKLLEHIYQSFIISFSSTLIFILLRIHWNWLLVTLSTKAGALVGLFQFISIQGYPIVFW